tara:strand:+ start:144 stop:701 length:558 start_codon:yes stop_codon:yes gene_type:complete
MEYIEFVIKQKIEFKTKYQKRDFLKKLRNDKLDNITSQLLDLYIKAYNPLKETEPKNIVLKIKEDTEETISIKKYNNLMKLKNKYYKENKELKEENEKLKKNKENIIPKIIPKAFDDDLFDEISSSSESDEEYDPYSTPIIKKVESESDEEDKPQVKLTPKEINELIDIQKLTDKFEDKNIYNTC